MEYRAYTFTHNMLSTIAQGIQSGHAITELFIRYPMGTDESNMLYEWAKDNKTHIALSGGNSVGLGEIIRHLEEVIYCRYPHAVFREDESLEGLVTSISFIFPEKIYQTTQLIRKGNVEFLENDTMNFKIVCTDEKEIFNIKKTLYPFNFEKQDRYFIELLLRSKAAR